MEARMQAAVSRNARMALIALGGGGFLTGLAVVVLNWGHGWAWLGAALMSLSPTAAGLVGRRLDGGLMRPAIRRYALRQAAITVVYFVVLFAATALYKRGLTEGPLGYLVAVAPAAPILGIFLILHRFLKEETDEMMREVFLSSLVWSGALTLCEATVWGFLETFGKVPHVWMWVVPVAFFAQLGLTGPLAGRKYR
jgi:hypothetical protein